MMKKSIGLWIALVIALSVFPYGSFAAQTELLFEQDFQDETIALLPYNISTSGTNENNTMEIVTKCQDERALQVRSTGEGNPKLWFDLSRTNQGISIEEFTLAFSIAVEESASDLVVSLRDKDRESARVLIFGTDRRIKAVNGSYPEPVGRFTPGEWNHFYLMVDTAKGTYSIMLNGEAIAQDLTLPATKTNAEPAQWEANVSGIELSTNNKSGDNTVFLLDDIYAYDSLEQMAKAQVLAKPEDSGVQSDVTFYANNTFNRYQTGTADIGMSYLQKTNKINIAEFPDKENKSVKMLGLGQDDFYVLTDLTDEAREYVLDFKIYFTSTQANHMLVFRDPTPIFAQVLMFSKGGAIYDCNSNVIGNYPTNQWIRVQVVMNETAGTHDIYLDGVKVLSGAALPDGYQHAALVRLQITPSGTQTETYLDDWRIYQGTELISDDVLQKYDENLQIPSPYVDMEKVKERFEGKTAFALTSQRMYSNGERTQMGGQPSAKVFEEGELTYLPIRYAAQAQGFQVEWDEEKQQVSIRSDSGEAAFTIGETTFLWNGLNRKMEGSVISRDGYVYAPLQALAQVFGTNVFRNGKLLVLEKETDLKPLGEEGDLELMEEMCRYLLYARPSAQEVADLYRKSPMQGQHPRIMITPGTFERIQEEIQTNTTKREWHEAILKKADEYLAMPVEKYEYNADGNILSISRQIYQKAQWLGYAYNMTGDTKYKDGLWKSLEAAGNFEDWDPRHFLDTAELCMAFAISYDWLYDAWTQEEKDFLSRSMQEKGIDVALQYYREQNNNGNWVTLTNNWNAVCSSGVANAAMAIADENIEKMANAVSYAMRNYEYVLPEFSPDGSWAEGLVYWEYTMRYLSYFYIGMENILGTTFDIEKTEGFSNTANFLLHSQGADMVFNFGDAGQPKVSPASLAWMGDVLGEQGLDSIRIFGMDLYQLDPEPCDMFWNSGETDYSVLEKLPLDGMYEGTGMVTFRDKFNDRNLNFLGLHGGYNGAHHGHWDMGQFIYDSMGVRWFVDLGPDEYSVTNYMQEAYRVRAEGHNTVVMNPSEDVGQNQTGQGHFTEYVSKPRGGYAILDMTDAYPEYAVSYQRGAMLTGDRTQMVLRDEFELNQPVDFYWFAHTRADITLTDGGKGAILTSGTKQLYVKLDTDLDAGFTVMPAEPMKTSPVNDTQSSNVGVSKLTLHVNGVQKGNITIRCTAMLETDVVPQESALPQLLPLSEWKNAIPDGEIVPLLLSDLTVDGETVSDFKPENSSYVVTLSDESISEIPVVAAESQGIEIEVEQAAELPGEAKVILKSTQTPGIEKSYTVAFRYESKVNEFPQDAQEAKILSVTASDVPEEANIPENTLDGDFDTRWAAQGSQWIYYDLGTSKTVTHVATAWMHGEKRNYDIDIQVSDDAQTWTTVMSGETGAKTAEYEVFKVVPRKGRYVRIVCRGSQESTWNSLTEVKIFTQEK